MYKILFALILFLNCVPISISAQKVNRTQFYSVCNKKFPQYKLHGNRKQTIEMIFDYWEKSSYTDPRWLAYILATLYRETAGTLKPVREGMCDTDECSIAKVTAYYNAGKIAANYAKPDEYGRSYFGRGYVQLTHKGNYKHVGQVLGWGNELVEHPELVMDKDKATVILIEGSVKGLFTKKKLSDYFNDTITSWDSARKIVNPGSKRAQITGQYGKDFYACLLGN